MQEMSHYSGNQWNLSCNDTSIFNIHKYQFQMQFALATQVVCKRKE